MKNIFLASKESNELANYLNSRGSINVSKTTDELEDSLKSMIISVDLLAIIDNFENIQEVIQSMGVLSELFKSPFFKPSEIIFYYRDNEHSEYFTTVIEDTSIPCKLKYIPNLYPNTIYSAILDLDIKEAELENKRETIYRILKKKDKSKYKPIEDDFEFNPKDNNVEEYKKRIERAKVLLPDEILKDNYSSKDILGTRLPDAKDLISIRNSNGIVCCITGAPSSGKTMLTIATSTSALHNKKKVLIIDLQENNSTSNQISILNMPKNILYVSKLSKEYLDEFNNNSTNNISLISFTGLNDFNIHDKYLILRMLNISSFDTILIDVDLKDIDLIKHLMSIDKVFITTSLKYSDVKYTEDILASINTDGIKTIFVIPMCVYREVTDAGYLTAEEAYNILSNKYEDIGMSSEFLILDGINVEPEFYINII